MPSPKVHAATIALYSLIGAVYEHLAYFFGGNMRQDVDPKDMKLIANPVITGFPVYALGAYLVAWIHQVIVKPLSLSVITEGLLYAGILSLIEYGLGIWLGAGPVRGRGQDGRVWSWDYSDEPYNINGIISLRHALQYFFAGLVIARLHPSVLKKIDHCL